MSYTRPIENDDTKWSLAEFIALHGNFSIIREAQTGSWCGRFSVRGVWTDVFIEKKVRGIAISEILHNQGNYEVVAVLKEIYVLYRKGDIIDYADVWHGLNPNQRY